ncbi:MAG: 4Fe-4S binding protein [Gammaproteobacteria bacterium]|nr:MAG: 4Fe-4S binding protein [Gammaproteobacteria bacterium]
MTTPESELATCLPAGTINGKARATALAVAGDTEREPAGIVAYQSAGRLLVVGTEEAIGQVTAALDTFANIYCTGHPGTTAAAPVVLSGYLGHFELQEGTAELQIYDLVLDLGSPPLLQSETLPPGYFAPGSDPVALQAALDEIPGLTGQFEKPQYFQYDASICAHGRSGITACTRCLDSCPTDAIRSLGERIEVNPNLCQGAGSCATACPTGAITYGYPRLADTLQRVRVLLQTYHDAKGTDAVVLFHDAAAGHVAVMDMAAQLPERVIPVEVEELGSVGMDTWLATLAYGAAAIALLATARLPASVTREVTHQLTVAREILSGMGNPATTLLLCQAGDTDLADTLATLPATDGRVPATFAALDEKRTVIRLAVEHLYTQAKVSRPLVALPAGAPFGEVQVDSNRCTLCMACVSQCPAHALEAGTESPQLVFIEANCVQCGLCCRTCPEDAIAASPRYLYDSQKRTTRRIVCEEEPFLCIRCGKAFATRQVIKKISSKMKDHPMFQGAALERLKMCEDCRVKAMYAEEGMGDEPASPGGLS